MKIIFVVRDEGKRNKSIHRALGGTQIQAVVSSGWSYQGGAPSGIPLFKVKVKTVQG